MKIDVESILGSVKTVLQGNLNTQLEAISLEKNDGLVIKSLDSEAYFLQTMNEGIANYDPFIFYGVGEQQLIGLGSSTAEKLVIDILICVADNGADMQLGRKMFRYQRALREIFEAKWADVSHGVKLKIGARLPTQFKFGEESFVAFGICLEVNFA